jgi:hypothetical protein
MVTVLRERPERERRVARAVLTIPVNGLRRGESAVGVWVEPSFMEAARRGAPRKDSMRLM